ncbi:hypothetical protein SARC_01402 [Sphaeroforma arctica JP610]|uniref:Uncharacterized protein n=1 Tax=Sphaeroforma arctica JP610 TaxID=667725 RepID=A0A0L0GC23_9EUKA|nr:hypothetical protein SARC_01402 [Sphaeroforma arctica JP610]KNC86446.1 hypothetical protein SARC_01402 [Sphaeroforma arctica JP610]|eukprot:XP_014160348.1 hypothetical protein SARC_01402 [Sphaeroforma arctica JP610]
MPATRTVPRKLLRGPRRVKPVTSSSTDDTATANRNGTSPSLGGSESPRANRAASDVNKNVKSHSSDATLEVLDKRNAVESMDAKEHAIQNGGVSEAKTRDRGDASELVDSTGGIDKKPMGNDITNPDLKSAGIKRVRDTNGDSSAPKAKGLSLREKLKALKRRRTEEESGSVVRSGSTNLGTKEDRTDNGKTGPSETAEGAAKFGTSERATSSKNRDSAIASVEGAVEPHPRSSKVQEQIQGSRADAGAVADSADSASTVAANRGRGLQQGAATTTRTLTCGSEAKPTTQAVTCSVEGDEACDGNSATQAGVTTVKRVAGQSEDNPQRVKGIAPGGVVDRPEGAVHLNTNTDKHSHAHTHATTRMERRGSTSSAGKGTKHSKGPRRKDREWDTSDDDKGACKGAGRKSGAENVPDVSLRRGTLTQTRAKTQDNAHDKARARKDKRSRSGSGKGRERHLSSDRERDRDARASSGSRGDGTSPSAIDRSTNTNTASSDRAKERRKERQRERDEEREMDMPIPKKKNVMIVAPNVVTNGNRAELSVNLHNVKTFRMCSPAPPPTSVQRQANTITHTYTYTNVQTQTQMQPQPPPHAYTLTNLRANGNAAQPGAQTGPQGYGHAYAHHYIHTPQNHTLTHTIPPPGFTVTNASHQTLTETSVCGEAMGVGLNKRVLPNGSAASVPHPQANGHPHSASAGVMKNPTEIRPAFSDSDSDVEMRDDDAHIEADYVSDSGHTETVARDVNRDTDLEPKDMDLEDAVDPSEGTGADVNTCLGEALDGAEQREHRPGDRLGDTNGMRESTAMAKGDGQVHAQDGGLQSMSGGVRVKSEADADKLSQSVLSNGVWVRAEAEGIADHPTQTNTPAPLRERGTAGAGKAEGDTERAAKESDSSHWRTPDIKVESTSQALPSMLKEMGESTVQEGQKPLQSDQNTINEDREPEFLETKDAPRGSMECPYMPADILGWKKLRHGVYLEIDSQGGGYVLHVFMSQALRQADVATQQLFVEDIVHESLNEDADGYAFLCMTIVHGAGSSVPNVLNALSATNPRLKVIVETFGKAGYAHEDVKDYVERIDKTYDSGVHQAGAMRNISLVGTIQEETGGYFPDVIDMLKANPFLRPTLPWGKLSSLHHMTPTESDDGPILWTRNGEQYYGVGDTLAKTYTNTNAHTNTNTNMHAHVNEQAKHAASCPRAQPQANAAASGSARVRFPSQSQSRSQTPNSSPAEYAAAREHSGSVSPAKGAGAHAHTHTHTHSHTTPNMKLHVAKSAGADKRVDTNAHIDSGGHSPQQTSPAGGCKKERWTTPTAAHTKKGQRTPHTHTHMPTETNGETSTDTHVHSGTRTGGRARNAKGTLGYKPGRTKSARERLYTDRTTVHADFSGRFPYRLPVAAVGLVQGIEPHTRGGQARGQQQPCTCHLYRGHAGEYRGGGGGSVVAEDGTHGVALGTDAHTDGTNGTNGLGKHKTHQALDDTNTDADTGGGLKVKERSTEGSTELFARLAAEDGFAQEQPVVCKEVVAFSACHMATLERVCRIDYNEEPMDQSIDRSYWVDQARLRQLARMGITYATAKLRSGDIYFIPRKIVHQFHTVAGCSSVAWHFRYEKYNEFKEIPKET